MRNTLIVLSASLFAAIANPSLAQIAPATAGKPCTAIAQSARTLIHPDSILPHVGVRVEVALNHDCHILQFYRHKARRLPDPQRPDDMPVAEMRRQGLLRYQPRFDTTPRFAAWVFTRGARFAPAQPENELAVWIEQDTCPALLTALSGLEASLTLGLTAGPSAPEPPMLMIDGSSASIWVNDRPYGGRSLTLESSRGAPALRNWIFDSLTQLEPCWASSLESPN